MLPKLFLLETGKYHYKLANQLLPTEIGNYFDTSATQVVRHTYSLQSQNNNRPPRFISKSKIGEKSIVQCSMFNLFSSFKKIIIHSQ